MDNETQIFDLNKAIVEALKAKREGYIVNSLKLLYFYPSKVHEGLYEDDILYIEKTFEKRYIKLENDPYFISYKDIEDIEFYDFNTAIRNLKKGYSIRHIGHKEDLRIYLIIDKQGNEKVNFGSHIVDLKHFILANTEMEKNEGFCLNNCWYTVYKEKPLKRILHSLEIGHISATQAEEEVNKLFQNKI